MTANALDLQEPSGGVAGLDLLNMARELAH
jgi:hypothetical protein